MKRFLVIFVLCLMPCALHAEYMCKQCYTSCTSAYQLNPDGNGSGCGTCEEAKCSGGQYWNGTECKACKIGYYCPVGSVSELGCVKGTGTCQGATNCTEHAGTEKDCNHRCPAGAYSDAGASAATSCHIKSGTVFSGTSGNFTFTANVSYKSGQF